MVDAIDNVRNKVLLIAECCRRGIPVITSGAAGGRLDGTRVQVADLAKSVQDPLLSKVRAALRRNTDFPGSEKRWVSRAYFPRSHRFSKSGRHGLCASRSEAGEQAGSMKLNCEWGFGAATHVTGAFGLRLPARWCGDWRP